MNRRMIKELASIFHEKRWHKVLLEWVVGIGAISQVVIGAILIYQLRAYEASNELTRQSLELSRKNFDLTAKSVDLAQQSIVLNQKSIDAAQAGLKFAQQANDLAKNGIIAANTPSVSIAILDVKKVDQNRIKVNYELKNHSSSVANYIVVECFLDKQVAVMDEPIYPGVDHDRLSVMPNSSFGGFVWFVTEDNKASDIIRRIDRGEINIKVLIEYRGPLNNESNFFEIFAKGRDGFGVVNLEPNVNYDSMFRNFLEESMGIKKH